jgi:hypothetical protein
MSVQTLETCCQLATFLYSVHNRGIETDEWIDALK